MFKLVSFALIALAAVSLVDGAAIFRRDPPDWNSNVLEVSVLFSLDRRSILKRFTGI